MQLLPARLRRTIHPVLTTTRLSRRADRQLSGTLVSYRVLIRLRRKVIFSSKAGLRRNLIDKLDHQARLRLKRALTLFSNGRLGLSLRGNIRPNVIGWVKLRSIILPLMMSSITICLFLTLSRAFMVYDVNLSLTAGAPYGTTEMAAMHVYERAFTSRQFGVGQAEALILFVIVAIISGIQVYLTKRQEVEA